jgi:hypothetical protein
LLQVHTVKDRGGEFKHSSGKLQKPVAGRQKKRRGRSRDEMVRNSKEWTWKGSREFPNMCREAWIAF